VSIARAFVNRPLILFADEPTGNLDPGTSVGIMRLLDRINRTGTTVVMATHDHAIVDAMRRRVVELDGGRWCATRATAATRCPPRRRMPSPRPTGSERCASSTSSPRPSRASGATPWSWPARWSQCWSPWCWCSGRSWWRWSIDQDIGRWDDNVRVIAWLGDDLTVDQVTALQADVETWAEVDEVVYYSKAQALEEFRELFADQPALIEVVEEDRRCSRPRCASSRSRRAATTSSRTGRR